MRHAAARLRLPFRSRTWRGETGQWLGAGIGSSIDFQDHRQYLPGDDPRYIDWQAYARTGHYTMKVYREEVSPRVDLVLDLSASMFFDDAKRERALELFYFSAESALQSGASLRCHALSRGSTPWPTESAFAYRLPERFDAGAAGGAPPALAEVPWRQGSLRVLVSDLLFPGSPEPLLRSLAMSKGRGVILVPYCAAEAEPEWAGNVEFRDCETHEQRVQHVANDLLERYARAYARHFDVWKEQCRRHAVLLARVAAEPEFYPAMRVDALRTGAVELVH
jgi:uncharacterized protein (DUF58 family)